MCNDIISELEQDNSRLVKESIIEREVLAKNDEFFAGCKLALDPLITFGVKQVPVREVRQAIGYDWYDFLDLCNKLSLRQLTGHDARDAIIEAMTDCDTDEWNNWYRRILIKDLKCGVSEKTINKVCKKNNATDYMIPVFSCMLAHDSANHEKKLVGKKMLDYKLDGVRVLAVYNKDIDTCTMYSRNGKEFHNFVHIENEIRDHLASKFTESMVLDGEMVSSSFQALMKQVHRKDNVEATDAKYAIFDMLPLKEFLAGESKKGLWERHQDLFKVTMDLPEETNLFMVEKQPVDLDTDMGQTLFKQYNKEAIDKGFEGIMIKDEHAPYECKRSYYMLKAKPFIEVSLTVVGVEGGTGRNEGKLGALICEGKDDGKFIKVNVGSGLTDDNRDDFWASQNKILNQIVEVRADAITKNQDDEHYSLRFPRFMRFRGFKEGEKI